jgi:phosphoribosylaminoimidazole-succinocarboxamide synthase
VRDIYRLPATASEPPRVLIVATDRISAFDVVLPTAIPDKGRVLTGMSRHWFAATARLVPNHLLGTDPTSLPEPFASAVDELRGRVMICRTVEVLPIEVIVRGYLAGSGWKEYLRDGAVSGVRLPPGLRESERLPEPIFTPSTKATVGHDENIDFETAVGLVGRPAAERVRELALALYRLAAARCESVGLILADTKFEFGVEPGTGELLLIDEVLTPDSSRFWDGAAYEPGRAQASFDKQFVRDWLEAQPWDKTPPGPELPPEVVEGTRQRYAEAFERITGASLDTYLREDRLG